MLKRKFILCDLGQSCSQIIERMQVWTRMWNRVNSLSSVNPREPAHESEGSTFDTEAVSSSPRPSWTSWGPTGDSFGLLRRYLSCYIYLGKHHHHLNLWRVNQKSLSQVPEMNSWIVPPQHVIKLRPCSTRKPRKSSRLSLCKALKGQKMISHAFHGALIYTNNACHMTHQVTHQGRLTLLLPNINDEPK